MGCWDVDYFLAWSCETLGPFGIGILFLFWLLSGLLYNYTTLNQLFAILGLIPIAADRFSCFYNVGLRVCPDAVLSHRVRHRMVLGVFYLHFLWAYCGDDHYDDRKINKAACLTTHCTGFIGEEAL